MKQYNNRKSQNAFTLIELLIVIGVLGILAVGVFAALNIVGTLDKTNLAKAKTFSASVENDLSIAQVGKWSFEEGSGTTAKDTSGYGNDGTLYGNDGRSENGPVWQNATQCGLGFGGCIKFSGGNYITVPPKQFEYTGGDMTISLWVKTQTDATFLSKPWNSAGKYNYKIIWSEKHQALACVGGETCTSGAITAESFSIGSWHNIVVVFASSKKGRIYVDGKLSAEWTNTITNWNPGNDNEPLTLGRVYPGAGGWFNGLMDEVAIYTQALTVYQIQQLYAQGLRHHQLAKEVSR